MLLEFIKIIIGVVSATIIYVITKFILDNILQQRTIMADIANSLIFYKNIYTNSMSREDDYREASNKFRGFASALRANVKIIPFYTFLEKLRAVCDKSNIDNAAMHLIGLSNGCLGLINQKNDDKRIENNEDRVNKIKSLLDLPFVD
jgi:hypothetical protein